MYFHKYPDFKLHRLALFVIISLILSGFGSTQNWNDIYWENLVIYRDRWGVPHIFANEPRVLGFGFGYAQAQDHWEAMLLAYRMATGRLAEVMGEPESQSDQFSIQAGHRHYGMLAYENCDDFSRELCEGFAEGVNAWIVENKEKLPEWVDGVNPKDIFSLWHAFIVSLAPLEHPQCMKRSPAIKSGFAFAYTSSKSKDNIPVLAFSAHHFYQGPFRWYEAHLACGDYYVYGTTLYGLPLILQGHSLTHAWAITPNQADFSDVFLETPSAVGKQNPKAIMNQSLPDPAMLYLQYMSQSDTFYVHTANGLEERLAPVHITPRGPLLMSKNNEFLSWKIGGYEDIGIFKQLWEMGRAKSLDAFINAVYMHQLPCFHIIFVNQNDQLYYLYSAKAGLRVVPEGLNEKEAERLQSINWRNPVSLQDYYLGWKYIITPDRLPNLVNPSAGYIQICGGPPNGVTDDHLFPNNIVLSRLILDVENVVSRRVKSVLRSDKRSIQETQSLLLDDLCSLAIETVPKILEIAEKNKNELKLYHPEIPTAVEILKTWDYRADINSSATTIFTLWTHFFLPPLETLPSVESEPVLSLVKGNNEVEKNCIEALAETVRFLKNNKNSIRVSWGDVHKIKRGVMQEPVYGSELGGCAYLLSELPPESDHWGNVHYGIGYAQIVAFSPAVLSYSIVPFGNSEISGSPHYIDQWGVFKERRMKKTYFYPDEIYHYSEEGKGRRMVFILLGDMGELRCTSSSRISVTPQYSITPPKELPNGLETVSLFYSFPYNPKEAFVQFALKIRIPQNVINYENINYCSIYVLKEDSMWEKIETQTFNYDSGFLEGMFERESTFAVLVPKEYIIRTEEDEENRNKENNTGENRGIFSPGLPGDIPQNLRHNMESRKKFVFQSNQITQLLPKPKLIPPIGGDNRKDDREAQNNESKKEDQVSNTESPKREDVRLLDRKQKVKESDQLLQRKMPSKNFTIKKKTDRSNN